MGSWNELTALIVSVVVWANGLYHLPIIDETD